MHNDRNFVLLQAKDSEPESKHMLSKKTDTMKESWKSKGYADEPVPEGVNLKEAIRELCKEKNAIILAHYYTEGDVQDVADFVGKRSAA